MKRHLRTYGLLLGMILSFSSNGQDPVFSQFYSAPLNINAAFTGNTLAPFFAANYRNQWTSLGGIQAYRTYALSYSQFFESFNSGIGVSLLTDDAGEGLINTHIGRLSYAYRVQVNRNLSFKLGAEAGAIQTRLDWDKLIFYDQLENESEIINPTAEIRPDDLNRTKLDVGAGFLAYTPKFYVGLSLKHLNTPDQVFIGSNNSLDTGLPLRMTIHGGAQISLSKSNNQDLTSFLSPNVMLIKQGDFGQVNVGTYVGLGKIYGGAWYRHAWSNPDAMIFLLGFQQDKFKIGYSFDLRLPGELNLSNTGGTHEISLILDFEGPRKSDLNDCFQMFR
ncbi:MAG: PorP/SprF family type IX secretion system membrane protein [Saprospiraceae bacterium]|nr:PorP/SprF family type IX secretion system membrane protein [Saprospiraceae bacterium]